MEVRVPLALEPTLLPRPPSSSGSQVRVLGLPRFGDRKPRAKEEAKDCSGVRGARVSLSSVLPGPAGRGLGRQAQMGAVWRDRDSLRAQC